MVLSPQKANRHVRSRSHKHTRVHTRTYTHTHVPSDEKLPETKLSKANQAQLEKVGGGYIRCRKLKGMDPEPEQLATKIEVLEERLNDKKEQLLEKELVLDEVTSLSDKLRMQAAERRHGTLDIAKKVNEYQAKIRAITRKMMAAVSELSMYQVRMHAYMYISVCLRAGAN